MNKIRQFRFENKYMLDMLQKENIKNYVESILDVDRNMLEGSKKYYIRSLYFDTYNSKAYRDNEAGVDCREKYRIRIYNCNLDFVFLERKIKVNGKIAKDRARIDKEILEYILSGRIGDIKIDKENSLLNRFWLENQMNGLQPRIIVDYERAAYVVDNIDVRITFDSNIAYTSDVQNFLNPNVAMQPILQKGKELLEVKFKTFFPEYLHQMLNLQNIQQCTFSKYYLCENFRRQGEYR